MEKLLHLEILDPPSKYEVKLKKVKQDKSGKLITSQTYYLTANIFYDGTHWAIKSKVVNYAKDWLILFLNNVPKIDKCQIKLTYHSPSDGFDLDNKAYFWVKILLDLLKKPSSKQQLNAIQGRGYKLKSVGALKDDTVKFVDKIEMEYKRGAHKLEIEIVGRKAEVQKKLF